MCLGKYAEKECDPEERGETHPPVRRVEEAVDE